MLSNLAAEAAPVVELRNSATTGSELKFSIARSALVMDGTLLGADVADGAPISPTCKNQSNL